MRIGDQTACPLADNTSPPPEAHFPSVWQVSSHFKFTFWLTPSLTSSASTHEDENRLPDSLRTTTPRVLGTVVADQLHDTLVNPFRSQ